MMTIHTYIYTSEMGWDGIWDGKKFYHDVLGGIGAVAGDDMVWCWYQKVR